MREMLKQMFTGWALREAAYDHDSQEYTRSEEDCMEQACDGDDLRAGLLVLFSHWSNDITSLAAHYGLELVRTAPDGTWWRQDGTIDTLLKPGALTVREDVPPAPSLTHWWNNGEWVDPEIEPSDVAAA